MGSFVSHGNINWELHFKHTATTNLLLIPTNANGKQIACGGTGCRVSYSRGSSGSWAAAGRDPLAGRVLPPLSGVPGTGFAAAWSDRHPLCRAAARSWVPALVGRWEFRVFFCSCLILNFCMTKMEMDRWRIWRWRTLFDVASFVYNWIFINVLFVVTF